MNTLGNELPKEIERCEKLLKNYKDCRGMANVNVEFAVAMLNDALTYARRVNAVQDVVGMIDAYKQLKSFTG